MAHLETFLLAAKDSSCQLSLSRELLNGVHFCTRLTISQTQYCIRSPRKWLFVIYGISHHLWTATKGYSIYILRQSCNKVIWMTSNFLFKVKLSKGKYQFWVSYSRDCTLTPNGPRTLMITRFYSPWLTYTTVSGCCILPSCPIHSNVDWSYPPELSGLLRATPQMICGSTGIRTPGRRITCNLQPRVRNLNHSTTASRQSNPDLVCADLISQRVYVSVSLLYDLKSSKPLVVVRNVVMETIMSMNAQVIHCCTNCPCLIYRNIMRQLIWLNNITSKLR